MWLTENFGEMSTPYAYDSAVKVVFETPNFTGRHVDSWTHVYTYEYGHYNAHVQMHCQETQVSHPKQNSDTGMMKCQ